MHSALSRQKLSKAPPPSRSLSVSAFPSSRIVTRESVYEVLASHERVANGHTSVDQAAVNEALPEHVRKAVARAKVDKASDSTPGQGDPISRTAGPADDDDEELHAHYERIRRELFLEENGGIPEQDRPHFQRRPRGRYQSTLAAAPREPPPTTWMAGLRQHDAPAASTRSGPAPASPVGSPPTTPRQTSPAKWSPTPYTVSPPRANLGLDRSASEAELRASHQLASATAWTRQMAAAAAPALPQAAASETREERRTDAGVGGYQLATVGGRSYGGDEEMWTNEFQLQLNDLSHRDRFTAVLDRFEAFATSRAQRRHQRHGDGHGESGGPPRAALAATTPATAPAAKASQPKAGAAPTAVARQGLPVPPPPPASIASADLAEAGRERRPWSPPGRYEQSEAVWNQPSQHAYLFPLSNRRLAEQKLNGKRRAS